jgi:hypothetical protein
MSDVSNIDFTQIAETSLETLRLSIDRTKTVLKYTGNTPSFLEGLQEYNHSEILAVMASPEWTNEQEDIL